jgi:hypothetical protein
LDGSVHSLFPVAITAAGREALREWVEGEKASRTIEIGLGYGIGGAVRMRSLLASAEANARHVVIDPHQATRFADCGLQFLEEAGVIELVEFHAEDRKPSYRVSSPKVAASNLPSSTAVAGWTACSST